jgi:predicted FMN-binding regulatory protein PaiB
VIHYDYYADVPDGAIADLLRASRLCRLTTIGTSDDGFPHVGLFPFTFDSEGLAGFELHLNRKDEQIADLRERPRCVLEVDEVLATIPSHWIDPDNAVFATAYHRTVAFECTVTLVEDAEGVAAQQNRIMARYQPEGLHKHVDASDPLYTTMLKMLVGIRLKVENTKVKFKLAQNRDFETRMDLVRRLRERGTDLDRRTADAIEWTVKLGWTTKARGGASK